MPICDGCKRFCPKENMLLVRVFYTDAPPNPFNPTRPYDYDTAALCDRCRAEAELHGYTLSEVGSQCAHTQALLADEERDRRREERQADAMDARLIEDEYRERE